MKIDLKRPPKRNKTKPKKSKSKKDSFWKRPPPRKQQGVSINKPKSKSKGKSNIHYKYHVIKYERKKVKTYEGSTGRQEARLHVAKLKEKDPQSRYQIKTEKEIKRSLF